VWPMAGTEVIPASTSVSRCIERAKPLRVGPEGPPCGLDEAWTLQQPGLHRRNGPEGAVLGGDHDVGVGEGAPTLAVNEAERVLGVDTGEEDGIDLLRPVSGGVQGQMQTARSGKEPVRPAASISARCRPVLTR